MRMLFKQRFFSWFDSYDIYDEDGYVLYTVKGQFSWGHLLKIYDADGREIATLQERVLSFLPKCEMFIGDEYIGCISREFSLFTPRYCIDCCGWEVEGDFLGWDYTVTDAEGYRVAAVSKQLLNWTDTYVIDVDDPADALCALMLVLAIDVEKCSNN